MPSTPIYFAADEKLLAALAEPLRRSGLELETFPSLVALRAAFDRELPGALLLGARLSDSTAYAALKSLSGPRHVPTLVIVGESQLDHRGQALRLGFADVAPSPLKPRVLASRLQELAGTASGEQTRASATGTVVVKTDDAAREAEVIEAGEQTLLVRLSPALTEDDLVELVFGRGAQAPLSLFGRVLTSTVSFEGSEATLRLLAMTPEETAALREIVRPPQPPPAPADLEAEAADGWPAGTVEASRFEPVIPDFDAEPEQGESASVLAETSGSAAAVEPGADVSPAPVTAAAAPPASAEPERLCWPAAPEPLDACVEAVARFLSAGDAPGEGSSLPTPLESAAEQIARQLGDFERRAFQMLRGEPEDSAGALPESAPKGPPPEAPVAAEAPPPAEGGSVLAPAERAEPSDAKDLTSFAASLENLALEPPAGTPAVPATEEAPAAPPTEPPIPAAADKGLDAGVARQLREGAGHRARVLVAVTSGRALADAADPSAPRARVEHDRVTALAADAETWTAALNPVADSAVAAGDLPLLVDLNGAKDALSRLAGELRELEERLGQERDGASATTEGLAEPEGTAAAPATGATPNAPASKPAPKSSAGLVWAVAFLLALAVAVVVWRFVR